jgi:FkbM family methyltransferase
MIEPIRDIRSVVDVGANQGLFTMYARALFPDARIHAYEPNRDLDFPLKENCRIAGAELFFEGVGAADGTCELISGGDSNLSRTVHSDAGGIRVTGIERVLDRLGGHADLLKLDCEGCEWHVFKARDSLRRVRYLTMEYHCWANGSGHDDIRPLLEGLGFVVLGQIRCSDFGQVLAKRAGNGAGG